MKTGHPADALIPPGLLVEIEPAAAEGRRPARELVGEAVERYLSERRWFRRDEVHAKIAQGLESLRQGKGLDGESVMAELIAELDGPHTARSCRATSSLPRAGTISARSGTIWPAKA